VPPGLPEICLSAGWLGGRNPRACVVGLGLIGGSWAGALNNLGWQVSAVEPQAAAREAGRELGWIEESWETFPQELEVDLLVLAAPLARLAEIAAALPGRLKPGCIVTDVGSLKTPVCGMAGLLAVHGIHFVGGHPMTGSEQQGIWAADPNLFRGYPYVLTPMPDCAPEVVGRLSRLLASLGAKVVLRPPEQHDRDVALVSHLPHVLAVSLALAVQDASAGADNPLPLAGRSFLELTRVAASSPDMWQSILVANAPALLTALDSWQVRMDQLRSMIDRRDGAGIAEAFRQANRVRASCLGQTKPVP